MFLVRNMSSAEFGSMFFKVNNILSKQNKKMKYTDWLELRDIAIGSNICECRKKARIHNMEELLADSNKEDIQVKIVGDTIYITCAECMGYLKTISHIHTAKEVYRFFTAIDEARESNTEKTVDKEIKKDYNNNIINNENKKENENMMNTNKMFKGLDFGKANKDLFRLSHLGLAVKNSEGTFVSYDKNNNNLVDVDLFDFDLDGMIYKMPVAHNQVIIGDVIIHNGSPVLVKDTLTNSDNLEVIDPVAGEIKTIIPTKNMFGFNFFTKILCLIDMNNLGASSDNPFGNMMPFMMMSAMKDGRGGNNDMMTMMMMSQMMSRNSQMGDMFSNPMMMMAMMSGDNMGDMLPMMMMSGVFNQQLQPQSQVAKNNMPSHSCGGNCTCNNNPLED